MKKKWIAIAVAVLLVLEAAFLIAERVIPKELSDLLPAGYSPETAYVHYYEWADAAQLDAEEAKLLLSLLEALEYRYDGRAFGTMYGELYHVSFFQPVENGSMNLWITKQRGIAYLDDKAYEMVGDTKPLLDYLGGLK